MLNKRSFGLLLGLISIILITAYIQYSTAPEFEADFSVFTPDEIQWIEDHPVIKYAPDAIFYPYEFYEDNEYKGLSPDYIDWIAEHYGLVFEFVEYETWDEILTALRNKEIDLITSTARSAQRDEYILFTAPYIDMDFVAFIRSDQDDNFF